MTRTLTPFSSALHRDAGQSIVELALCMPLFLMLMVGTAEIASIAWDAIQVQNAARAGAQFGSQSRANAADGTDIATAATNDAPRLTSMRVTSSSSCQCIDTTTGSTAGTGCATLTQCPSPYLITEQVQVNTTATVAPMLHYPGLPASFTLKGQAVMGVQK
jgi:Flp pilus assembly protein TadG